jgi:hypothetical protein
MALFAFYYGVRSLRFAVCGGVQRRAPRAQSPSELNAPAVASKRSASFFFKAKICVFVPFSAACASQSRTESSPGALRSFCGSRGKAPPPAASSALHLRRLCRVPCVPPAAVAPAASCAFIAACMI